MTLQAPRLSAVGAKIEAPKGVPSQEKNDFDSQYGEFWCILVVFFTVQLPVLHAKWYNLVPFHIFFIFFSL